MMAVTLSCFVRVKWKYVFMYLLLPKPNKTKIFCPLPFYPRCKGVANSGMVSCFSLFDNTAVHHTQAAVVDRIHATGAMVVFLPPYSPDFMPREELFAQTKNWIRENDAPGNFAWIPNLWWKKHFFKLLMNKLETTFDMPNTCDK